MVLEVQQRDKRPVDKYRWIPSVLTNDEKTSDEHQLNDVF
jgi:hypothetical protein